MTIEIEPGALLKKIALPGWVEMRVTQINLRTDAAKKFAACVLDRWDGASELPAPEDIPKPRSVEMNELALQLRSKLALSTVGAVVITLAALLFDFGGAAYVIAAVWVCWLVVLIGSGLLRAATERPALEYQKKVEDAELAAKRRTAPELTRGEMQNLAGMLSTTEGKLAYAAAVLAGETETSPVWKDALFDDFHVRVDLRRHVGEIAESARALSRARLRLGERPSGALSDDETITELYDHRVRELDQWLSKLTQRVHGLLIYRDHIRGFEPLVEKRKWLETHREDQLGFLAAASAEQGSDELRIAAEEIESRTREAMNFLVQDAERLSRM